MRPLPEDFDSIRETWTAATPIRDRCLSIGWVPPLTPDEWATVSAGAPGGLVFVSRPDPIPADRAELVASIETLILAQQEKVELLAISWEMVQAEAIRAATARDYAGKMAGAWFQYTDREAGFTAVVNDPNDQGNIVMYGFPSDECDRDGIPLAKIALERAMGRLTDLRRMRDIAAFGPRRGRMVPGDGPGAEPVLSFDDDAAARGNALGRGVRAALGGRR